MLILYFICLLFIYKKVYYWKKIIYQYQIAIITFRIMTKQQQQKKFIKIYKLKKLI